MLRNTKASRKPSRLAGRKRDRGEPYREEEDLGKTRTVGCRKTRKILGKKADKAAATKKQEKGKDIPKRKLTNCP